MRLVTEIIQELLRVNMCNIQLFKIIIINFFRQGLLLTTWLYDVSHQDMSLFGVQGIIASDS